MDNEDSVQDEAVESSSAVEVIDEGIQASIIGEEVGSSDQQHQSEVSSSDFIPHATGDFLGGEQQQDKVENPGNASPIHRLQEENQSRQEDREEIPTTSVENNDQIEDQQQLFSTSQSDEGGFECADSSTAIADEPEQYDGSTGFTQEEESISSSLKTGEPMQEEVRLKLEYDENEFPSLEPSNFEQKQEHASSPPTTPTEFVKAEVQAQEKEDVEMEYSEIKEEHSVKTEQTEEMPEEIADDPTTEAEPQKLDDEGEIVSDQESGAVGTSSEGRRHSGKKAGRKRQRNSETGEKEPKKSSNASEGDESPRNKKSALEHLRSMKFTRRDPFNSNESAGRENRAFPRFNREISPIRSRPLEVGEQENRKRLSSNQRPAAAKYPNRSNNNKNNSNQADIPTSTEEQRRQRSTMFLLQNQQQQNQLPAIIQKNAHVVPLKQRIENLLSIPDDQVFSLPPIELKALLVHAADLCREQDRLLSGRKAQLMELDHMIQKERELIERISQDLPPQYRPNLSDELIMPRDIVSPKPGSFQQKMNGSNLSNGNAQTSNPMIQPTDFSVPPPMFNELATPLMNIALRTSFTSLPKIQAAVGAPPIAFQPNQPPPAIALGIATSSQDTSSSVATFSLANMNVPPPLQPICQMNVSSSGGVGQQMTFSQLPPHMTSTMAATTTISSAIPSLADTSIPPPIPSFSTSQQQQQNPTNTISGLPLIFSIPPPSSQTQDKSMSAEQSQQQQNQSLMNLNQIQRSNPSSNTSSTQFNVPPPQINTSIPPPLPGSFSQNPGGLDLSVPPPTMGMSMMGSLSCSSATITLTTSKSPQHQLKNSMQSQQSMLSQSQAQIQHQIQLKQQIQALLAPDMTSVPPPNIALQLSTAPLSLLQGKQGNQQGARQGTATPPRPAGPPRPLMSIDQPPPPGLIERLIGGGSGANASSTSNLRELVLGQQSQQSQNKPGNKQQHRQQQQQQDKARGGRQQPQGRLGGVFNKQIHKGGRNAAFSKSVPVQPVKSGLAVQSTGGDDSALSVTTAAEEEAAESQVSNAGSFSPRSSAQADADSFAHKFMGNLDEAPNQSFQSATQSQASFSEQSFSTAAVDMTASSFLTAPSMENPGGNDEDRLENISPVGQEGNIGEDSYGAARDVTPE